MKQLGILLGTMGTYAMGVLTAETRAKGNGHRLGDSGGDSGRREEPEMVRCGKFSHSQGGKHGNSGEDAMVAFSLSDHGVSRTLIPKFRRPQTSQRTVDMTGLFRRRHTG